MNIRYFFFLICIFILLIISNVFAGTTGEIQGSIKDAETDKPINSVTIEVLGTEKTTISDSSGYFIINGLDVGIYNIKITHKEYVSEIHKNVPVLIDVTTTEDFILLKKEYWDKEFIIEEQLRLYLITVREYPDIDPNENIYKPTGIGLQDITKEESEPKTKTFTKKIICGHIKGKIFDRKNKKVIGDAQVITRNKVITTDSNGKFIFKNLSGKKQKLIVISEGYMKYSAEIKIKDGETTELEIFLQPLLRIRGKEILYMIEGVTLERDGELTTYTIYTGTITGRIIDKKTKNGIVNSKIIMGDYQTLTDKNGVFILQGVLPNKYEIIVIKQGYRDYKKKT